MERTRKMPFFNPYEPLNFAVRSLVSQWHIALCFMLLYGAATTFLIDNNRATFLVENTAALGTNKPWLFLVLTIIFRVFSGMFLITSALSWYKTGKISLGALFQVPLSAWFFLFLMQCINMSFAIFSLVGAVSAIFVIALLYLFFKTLFVERYLVDKNSSLVDAVKKSFELTYRYKWRFVESLFLYTLFFSIIILFAISVGICALIALFFSIPFEQVTQWMAILEIVTSPILMWIFSFAITYVYCKIVADYENNEQERIGDSVDQKSVIE